MLRKFALALATVGTIGAGAALMPSEASAGGYYGSYAAPVHYRPHIRHWGHRRVVRVYRPHYVYPSYYAHPNYWPRRHAYGPRRHHSYGPGISLRFGGGGFY